MSSILPWVGAANEGSWHGREPLPRLPFMVETLGDLSGLLEAAARLLPGELTQTSVLGATGVRVSEPELLRVVLACADSAILLRAQAAIAAGMLTFESVSR